MNIFFPPSLSLAPPLFRCPPRNLSFSIVLIRIWSDRVDAARAPALCVLLFLLIARYFALSLSVYLEGEIISNYRENRRRRKLPCASPAWASEQDLSSRIGYLAAFGPI